MKIVNKGWKKIENGKQQIIWMKTGKFHYLVKWN